jgi:glycosyltransferase involved in cell wall biosynthesis
VSLVSVIIPVFNRENTIARSIDSVFSQTYQPIELIVVDDGSTDSTVNILLEYGHKIKLIQQPNKGPSAARNTGVANAEGEIIAFLDSDDTWHPTKLERQIKLMARGGTKVSCCICNALNMTDGIADGTSFQIAGLDCKLNEGYWLNPCELVATRFILFNQVVAIRRCAFEKIGGFKEDLRILEDHDLAFRLSLLGPWAFISDTLVTKYDQADGLGVRARQDPLLHLNAWIVAVKGFLNEALEKGGRVERRILSSLRDASIEIDALKLIHGGGAIENLVGKFIKLSLRVKRGIQRRSPYWPKPKAVVDI